MSKVGNLRAMFENKGETSPPERGRSPGLSAGTESPRPLSKIRTNFVAIEKDGRIGLQRDPSSDSVLSVTRKPSGDTEGDAPVPAAQESTSSFAERIKSSRHTSQMEPIPQSPAQDMPNTFQSLAAPGQAAAQAADKSRIVDGKSSPKAPAAENKTHKDARVEVASATAKATKKEQIDGINGKTAVERDKTKAPSKEGLKPGSSKPAPKVAAISTAKVPTKAPTKSPANLKTPTSPLKGPKLPAKTPEKKTLHPDKTSTPKAASKAPTAASAATRSAGAAAAAEASASATKKPPALQASPAGSLDRGVGFVKPKVKSPTRPANLPAGLTTHTAASATKANPQRQSVSRQSGAYLSAHPPQGRSPSRASVSTVGGGGGGTLRRQSSTINRPRPSLGPPPKQPSADHPVTRREREVDEGFLARMMRPTQASSSKTNEKVVTPPRKAPGLATAAKRPAVKDTTWGAGAAKKAPSKAEGAVVKKAIPKGADAASESKPTLKAAEKKPPVSVAAASQMKKAQEEEHVAAPESEAKLEPKPENGAETEVVEEQAPEKTGDVTTGEPAPSTDETAAEQSAESTAEPAAEPQVQTVTEQMVTPVEAPAVDGSVEETASEAEPAEPNTPVEAADNGQENNTGLVSDGTEGKLAEDDKAVLEIEKRADDTTIAD